MTRERLWKPWYGSRVGGTLSWGMIGLTGLVGCDTSSSSPARRIEPTAVPSSVERDQTRVDDSGFSNAPKRIATH